MKMTYVHSHINFPLGFFYKKFIIAYKKNSIVFYKTTQNRISLLFKKIKYLVVINCILFLICFPESGNFVTYDLNKNFKIYCLKFYKIVKVFFCNLNIVMLKKNPFVDSLFFIIHNPFFTSDHFLTKKSESSYLGLVDLDEYKCINILELKTLWFRDNLINFINQKTVVLFDNNKIIILIFSLNFKVIYKKIVYKKNEIYFTIVYLDILLTIDRKKNLNLFNFKITKIRKKHNTIYTKKIFIKKNKSWCFKDLISCALLNKKNLIISFFKKTRSICINLKNFKKQPFFSFRTNCDILGIIVAKNYKNFLIFSSKTLFFCNKFSFMSKLFKLYTFDFISIFFENKLVENKFQFKLKIFPILVASTDLFLITNENGGFYFANTDENLVNFNLIQKNWFEKCTQQVESDVIGKYIYILKNFFVIKHSTQVYKKYNITISTLCSQRLQMAFRYEKKLQFSIDRRGENLAILSGNFFIEIQKANGNRFSENEFLPVTLISSKKILIFSVSHDGKFLILFYFNVLVLWETFPDIKKIETFQLQLKSSILFLKFLVSKEKKIAAATRCEILLIGVENFSIIWKFKINTLDLCVNNWSNLFAIKTKCIFIKNIKISEAIIIFKNSPVPIAIFNFSNICIFSFCFSYFGNFNNKKSILCLDSLLLFRKLFF